jgi:hypothetical protein
LFIGGVIGIGGTFLSSFLNRNQYPLFVILFAGCFGCANGLTYIVATHISWLYFPKKEGFISGIIIGSFGMGGFVFGFIS